MSEATIGVLLVCVCAVGEGAGQLAFKLSVTRPVRHYYWIAAGLVFFILDAVLYSLALRYLAVNIAFAIGSLGMVSIAIMSRFFLKERIVPIRWIGILLIAAGTVLIVSQA